MGMHLSRVPFRYILFSALVAVFQSSDGRAAQPPALEGAVAVTLVSPIPISPSGTASAPSSIFSWAQTRGAGSYVLWYADGNGRTQVIEFPTSELDCSDTTLVCKTKTPIETPEAIGEWAVRAVKQTEYSSWSKIMTFGKESTSTVFDRCVLPEGSSVLTGDFNNVRMFGGEWSVGTSVQAQAIRYDFSTKQAGFNNGLGAGASFRYYKDVKMAGGNIPVSRIRQECRASSFRLKSETTVAAPFFSVTPTIFASKLNDTANLIVQPAIMFGFFEDIINVGVGFNLTGRPGEVGDVFLLMSLGTGFQF